MDDNKDDFFTKARILKQCAELTKQAMNDDEHHALKRPPVYVDFSAGNNEFARLLGLPYLAVDLYASHYQPWGTVHEQDWFNTRAMPNRDAYTVVLGLNAPFGKRSALIHKFLLHAWEQFHADWMVLIVPHDYQLPLSVKEWYELVQAFDLRGSPFYRPDTQEDAYVGVWCQFRIYKRRLKPVIEEKEESKDDLFDILTLDDLYSNPHLTSTVSPRRIWMVRRWGRQAGRRFLEPQDDGSINHVDSDSQLLNRFQDWQDLKNQMSGATFMVVLFRQQPFADHSELRQRWIEELKAIAPQFWDKNNQKHKFINNTKGKSIVNNILLGNENPEIW